MKWSFKLGALFGIGVHVHASFLLLLAWVGYGAYHDTHALEAVFASMLFVIALFGLVVMHEYGHALTARRFGIRTLRITLYPIGGVAMLQNLPQRPREQLLIALAGPFVNFALAGLIALALSVTHTPLLPLDRLGDDPASLASMLLWANLVMGGFNLLPALPMDGGRVLRALLNLRMGPVPATRIAAAVAKLVAIAMFAYALHVGQMVLLAISIVVWFGSNAERRMAGVAARMQAERPAEGPRPGYNTWVVPRQAPGRDHLG